MRVHPIPYENRYFPLNFSTFPTIFSASPSAPEFDIAGIDAGILTEAIRIVLSTHYGHG